MGESVERAWREDIPPIQVLGYADGDITIQEVDADGLPVGFVLRPKQVNRLCTVAGLLTGSGSFTSWGLGANCTGQSFSLQYEASRDQFVLTDGTDELRFSEPVLLKLVEHLESHVAC